MIRTCLVAAIAISSAALASQARAEMPLFAAKCPMGGNVDANRTGTVRAGSQAASVSEFNPNYYEATHGGAPTFALVGARGNRAAVMDRLRSESGE